MARKKKQKNPEEPQWDRKYASQLTIEYLCGYRTHGNTTPMDWLELRRQAHIHGSPIQTRLEQLRGRTNKW